MEWVRASAWECLGSCIECSETLRAFHWNIESSKQQKINMSECMHECGRCVCHLQELTLGLRLRSQQLLQATPARFINSKVKLFGAPELRVRLNGKYKSKIRLMTMIIFNITYISRFPSLLFTFCHAGLTRKRRGDSFSPHMHFTAVCQLYLWCSTELFACIVLGSLNLINFWLLFNFCRSRHGWSKVAPIVGEYSVVGCTRLRHYQGLRIYE